MKTRTNSALLLVLCLSSCATDQRELGESYEYRPPQQIGDGLPTSDLSRQGFDEEIVVDLMRRISSGSYGDVHGVLVVRGGELVLEEYFGSYRRENKHMIASCTKSFVSALIGIALEQGHLDGVDARVFRFFPEYEHLRTADKDDIRVSHLLTMSAGFDWDETTTEFRTDPDNTLYQMTHSDNWTEFVLSRPMLWVPGERFNYCCGCSILLGSIIYKATGLPADLFAEIHLLEPLGITDHRWDAQPDGLPQTEGGLYLRPRDMAKFGLLILNDGVWNGRRIISDRWVRESTRQHLAVADNIGYGYHWWRQAFTVDDPVVESVRASGWKGQFIYIFPSLDMVVVFTMFNDSSHALAASMLNRYLLPSALGTGAR